MSEAADSPALAIPERIVIGSELRLRIPTVVDAGPLFATVNTNREHLRRWLPWLDQNRSLDQSRAFIEGCARARVARQSLTWLIEHERVLAGVISIDLHWQNRAGEIGYWLTREFEGRGLMSRSVTALVDLALGGLALHRVEIRVAVGNARSRAIPERLGFTREGTTRDSEWLYDHFESLVVYSRLSTDPKTTRPRATDPRATDARATDARA